MKNKIKIRWWLAVLDRVAAVTLVTLLAPPLGYALLLTQILNTILPFKISSISIYNLLINSI